MPIQTIGNIGPLALRSNRDGPEAPASRSAPSPVEQADDDALARAVEAVNKMLDPMARGLQFSVDASTGKTVVKLVDKETNEVLREMPSREMLAIARALDRVQGLLFDGHA